MQEILRQIPGVIKTTVGYTGGTVPNPTYEMVCSHTTGHAEAVKIVFDPAKLSYEQLLGFFFRMHDPTTLDQQENDIGAQYRSAIFYTSDEQKQIAERVKTQVDKSGKWKRPIVTEITKASDILSGGRISPGLFAEKSRRLQLPLPAELNRMNPHTDAPEPVLLIIADISGYTRYMTANAKTLAHSQTLITELVESIIEQVQVPLEVAKLEGDAIFLFCRKPKDAGRWLEIRADISRKLLDFFQRFREKISELGRSNTCICNACTHLEKLRLKIIVHSGEALFHRVLHFNELAGADVIIVHRLLKNSVPADAVSVADRSRPAGTAIPQNDDFQNRFRNLRGLWPHQNRVSRF